MRSFLLIIIFFSFSISLTDLHAQYNQSVQWEYECNKIENETYEFICIAKIERLWYLYAQTNPDFGPDRLTFVYDDNDNGESIILLGKTEGNTEASTFFHPFYSTDVQYFTGEVIFTQKIQFKKKTDVKVYISGLTRNKMTQMERKISSEYLFKIE